MSSEAEILHGALDGRAEKQAKRSTARSRSGTDTDARRGVGGVELCEIVSDAVRSWHVGRGQGDLGLGHLNRHEGQVRIRATKRLAAKFRPAMSMITYVLIRARAADTKALAPSDDAEPGRTVMRMVTSLRSLRG